MRKTPTRIAACTLSAAMVLALAPTAAFAQTEQAGTEAATQTTTETAAASSSASTNPASGSATTETQTGVSTNTGAGAATTNGTSTETKADTGTATTGGNTSTTASGTQTDMQLENVNAAIDALPELAKATHDDNANIKAANKAYGKLTSAQKAQVTAERVAKLTQLYAAYEAAVKVSGQIKALPKVSAVAAKDYDAIQAVAKAYEKLAQPALVSSDRAKKLAELQDAVLYAATPTLTYKVKSTSGATTTVADSKKHTFKGGIGKIKVYQPKSSVNGKTKLAGTVSYGIKTYGGKTVTASEADKWLGSSSPNSTEQAFKLKISGTVAEHYTAYYRVKVSKLGWSDWASSGTWAGSTGMNLRLTGLQVKFVKKGASAPGTTANPSLGASKLTYRVNQVSGGWTSYKKSGSTAGTASWKAGIKQVQVATTGDLSGSAQTSILTRKGSWTSYKSGAAGSSSKSKQAQAVRIKLTGELSKVYNVYYRVYASDHHWLGWAKNGQKAGTQGHKYSMGAIQIRLRLKGTGAPGSTAKHFTTKAVPSYSGGELTMVHKAQGYSSSTGWLILVNRNTTQVGVFTGSKGNWKLKKYFNCDVGASSTPTPKGTRYVQYKQRSFGEDKGYSVYKATNIGGGYFFHSIIYDANTMHVQDGVLGEWRSHGCIRLAYNNAKYIYDHVSIGTTVKIY